MRNWYGSNIHNGVRALISHEVESFDLIQRVVKEEKPDFIVELGSAFYGLTLLLHECDPRRPLFAFDIIEPLISRNKAMGKVSREDIEKLLFKAFRKSVTFIKGDVINKKNRYLIALLGLPDKKLLYCDNGNKPREIVYYAPCMKKGDVLGVHDWGTEVDPAHSEVASVLSNFEPHYLNREFENRKLLTRFFIKVSE